MLNIKILFIYVLTTVIVTVKAQSLDSLVKGLPYISENERLDSLGLYYSKPQKILRQGEYNGENFRGFPRFFTSIGWLRNGITIEGDGEFITYPVIPYMPNKKEDAYWLALVKISEAIRKSNTYHLDELKRSFTLNSEERVEFSEITYSQAQKDAVYFPSKVAKNYFNADTLIVYPINMYEGEKVAGKYTHCEQVIIQKNNVGVLSFYNFYTDLGFRNRKKYLKTLTCYRFKI